MPREREEREVCPRCGAPVSWFERHSRSGRTYLYAVHYLGRERGKKRVRKCYLGPVDDYEYVSRLHFPEGLRLRGLSDPDRALAYLDALINYIRNIELSPSLRQQLAERFERLAKVLRGEEGGEA